MKDYRVLTETSTTLHNESEDYSVYWTHGSGWVRFSHSEFQFTCSPYAVEDLKKAVDAYLDHIGGGGET